MIKRTWEHKQGLVEGFTKQYNVHQLVYFEQTLDIHEALAKEKRMKKWLRQWKIQLIEKNNLEWKDLYFNLTNSGSPLSRG